MYSAYSSVCATIPWMTLTLDELREQLTTWKGIDIAQTSNPVPGHGNSHADIVFVGEAPGQKEDEQGVPFVGQAGKLLDQLLASIGLERQDIYITNVVKFRPPENRDPTKEEKEACLPFLTMELEIIKPRIVVPLGRHALMQFLPDISIGVAHGTPHLHANGYTVFPLYHPAAALYNPALRQTLFDDMNALGNLLKEQKI